MGNRVTPRVVALVIGVGLATGVLTQVLQSVLPTGASQAANAIAPWLLVAFLVGSVMPGRWGAALAGAAALAFALIGYYAMTELRYGIGGGTGALVFLGLGALVGGPVFGLAGYLWRTADYRVGAASLGLLAAAFLAEAGYRLVVLGEPAVAAGFVLAGLAVPIVLGRSPEDRLGAYVATVPALLLGAIGFVVFLWIYDLTTRLAA